MIFLPNFLSLTFLTLSFNKTTAPLSPLAMMIPWQLTEALDLPRLCLNHYYTFLFLSIIVSRKESSEVQVLFIFYFLKALWLVVNKASSIERYQVKMKTPSPSQPLISKGNN